MPLLTAGDRRFLAAFSKLAYCNPFHPERIELERAALGKRFTSDDGVAWSRTAATADAERPNVVELAGITEKLAERMRAALSVGTALSEQDLAHYEDLVLYVLYYRGLAQVSPAGLSGHKTAVAAVWKPFREDFDYFFGAAAPGGEYPLSAAHLFACLYQLRRAFRQIFDCILGESLPAARLRGQVWQSIFTHDMRRYRRALYHRMADLATLVTGPSGTGKELVARAIANSQYIAFDPATKAFVGKPDEAFVPINLSALSATLIESELFGHCRGAYTGAVGDRPGWLEACPPHGAAFLDEIGELDPAIQVKLLRVVQSRRYCRLGETTERPFVGKIIAATNRDLAEEMHSGQFRADLYYRLCSDRIETPSLREQLADRPEALVGLVGMIAERVAGDEAPALAAEVLGWIEANLPADYAWPGNIRELEQCVRNIMVRGAYTPPEPPRPQAAGIPDWLAGAVEGGLTADELIRRYATSVYAKNSNYEQTAKLLGLDRRTVRAKIDQGLLDRLREGETP